MAKEKEYCIIGKDTKYFKTYVKAKSEKQARENAIDYHINNNHKVITRCEYSEKTLVITHIEPIESDVLCYVPQVITYDVKEKTNG